MQALPGHAASQFNAEGGHDRFGDDQPRVESDGHGGEEGHAQSPVEAHLPGLLLEEAFGHCGEPVKAQEQVSEQGGESRHADPFMKRFPRGFFRKQEQRPDCDGDVCDNFIDGFLIRHLKLLDV